MTMEKHDPDPEFLARLERDLVTEHRRLERLGPAEPRRSEVGKWLRAAVWGVAGLLLGAASLSMAQRLEANEQVELLLHRAEVVARIAAQRVDVSRRMLETVERDHEVGVVGDSQVAPARAAFAEAETELALAHLDLEELAAAGRAARKEISAPLVRGRDFVTERLRVELDATTRRMELLEPVIAFAETSVRVGLDVPTSLSPLVIERARLAAAAERLRASLDVRGRFLGGEVSAEQAELRHALLLATARYDVARTTLERLRPENERLRQRQQAGLIPETDLYAATQRLLEAEAETELVQIEIDLLERELARLRND